MSFIKYFIFASVINLSPAFAAQTCTGLVTVIAAQDYQQNENYAAKLLVVVERDSAEKMSITLTGQNGVSTTGEFSEADGKFSISIPQAEEVIQGTLLDIPANDALFDKQEADFYAVLNATESKAVPAGNSKDTFATISGVLSCKNN